MMKKFGLYDPQFEHDNCGIGLVVNINGEKTHDIISDGVTVLKNLEHRGALGGDLKTGDGAGLLSQIPHAFFERECKKIDITLPSESLYGVGMMFMPKDEKLFKEAIEIVDKKVADEGGLVLGWRDVPVCPECLGDMARKVLPHIAQVFVSFAGMREDRLERELYITRKVIEKAALDREWTIDDLYIASFSSKTIVYKGMFVAPQFEHFYPDLTDPQFTSALVLVHQRYSTNTFPSWPLAQPFRYMCHNGEINSLRGNINKMVARENTLSSDLFGDEIKKLRPIIQPNQSDSGSFDNAFELLSLGGRSIEHSMMMMVPEAFGSKYHISRDKRAFYEYHAAIMEPWDGPAAIAFTDGTRVGAVLDRNGLRPARYVVSKSGKLVLASEIGVLDIPAGQVAEKGRLAPGKMLLIDTVKKRIIYDNEIKSNVSRHKLYRRWLEQNRIELRGLFAPVGPVEIDSNELMIRRHVFGYTLEDIKMVLIPMVENAQEPVGSMGNDAALAVLSDRPQLLYNYFKQLFAQVTNPPLDPYRENLVMSLMSFVGRESNMLDEKPEHCHQLKLPHPVLTNDDMEKLREVDVPGLKSSVLPMVFDPARGEEGLREALQEICSKAEEAIENGTTLLVLSDSNVGENLAPIPALLATSTLHHHLIMARKRQLAGLIVETGEARDVMHFATLIGYGASAINPYLAIETIAELSYQGRLGSIKLETAIEHYITAVKKGLLKIMSKIGVSTIRSYRGAQIFEAVGLNTGFVDTFFPGTPSRIEGIGLEVIAKETVTRHKEAYTEERRHYGDVLDSGGNIHFRRFSERHLLSPEAVALVQKSIRENDYSIFRRYSAVVNDNSKYLCTLRGLFSFKQDRKPIPIDEVEPVEEIVKRFVSSAMSFGSISKEAHETIAIAMNRIGAMSNSGEGGEDEERYIPLPNGDSKKSFVKQVASGRFGVNSNYLVNSGELQIKMAQGAKPGEGGQLPGHKVDDVIARVRYSTPGVMLISPPPHHDIYSIEDLAQLIYDLKNANPRARVSVKLVSEVGVGTVAAGVAKGKADMVLISGHDGGTGASPISSIKYAGVPWEIGVAETQQTLVMNRLRDKIRVQTDGQMKTGRDVVIAALLGAEEYGFGTMSLVSMGCIMMRKCHLNTCPVGVATQDESLRARFRGKPEYLVNFMMFIAQEVREYMAQLGFRKIEEMIGRVDVLDVNRAVSHWKSKGLDFSRILAKPETPPDCTVFCSRSQTHDFSLSLDPELIGKCADALEKKKPVKISMPIRNCNRTVGTTLSSEVSTRYGAKGLPPDTISCKFTGSAGQSFGAFLARGVTFELEGDSNDYFGKGLSGGKLILYPPKDAGYKAQNNIITGNVNLFGATSGEAYINGMAGERFAVRNSGATAVVEGVGDHGCEYMTGGCVVVLGKTGVNFAAGMSGGIAYVLDENQLFDTRCNLEMVDLEPVLEEEDKHRLEGLLKAHVSYTDSEIAKVILQEWTNSLPKFVKVMPIDYKRALARIKREESKETDVVSMTEEVFY